MQAILQRLKIRIDRFAQAGRCWDEDKEVPKSRLQDFLNQAQKRQGKHASHVRISHMNVHFENRDKPKLPNPLSLHTQGIQGKTAWWFGSSEKLFRHAFKVYTSTHSE